LLLDKNMAVADHTEIDRHFMSYCIGLSRQAKRLGEFPFVSIICRDGSVIAEAINQVGRSRDLTQHAEMISISRALSLLRKKRLRGCDIYSNVEPCPMCAFAIRESGMRRVVYALKSPVMGGLSKWNILADDELSRVMPGFFGPPPTVIGGVLAREAEEVWSQAHPILWPAIKKRGCFVCESLEDKSGSARSSATFGVAEFIRKKYGRVRSDVALSSAASEPGPALTAPMEKQPWKY
jgi:tRNA(adenine34) deaminase